MYTLKIEHGIRDFDTWKVAFDRDPIDRKRSGVRRHRICQPVDDRQLVLVDLDFDNRNDAAAFLEALRTVWSRADLSPGLSRNSDAASPRTAIVEQVEDHQY
jgi:hypothetical protein